MRQGNSADQSAMPSTSPPYHPEYAGALDALANFWFKRIEFADGGDRERPAMNLEMSADAALFFCLKPHGITNERSCVDGTFEDGFNIGLQVAAILTREPFDAEASLREVLMKLVVLIEERRIETAEER